MSVSHDALPCVKTKPFCLKMLDRRDSSARKACQYGVLQ